MDEDGVQYENCLQRVEESFWKYHRLITKDDDTDAKKAEREYKAGVLLRESIKASMGQFYFEARIAAVTFYYARMKGQKIVRAQACCTKLTEAQYMQAIPSWAAPFEDCWLQVIRQKWCKEEWLQISESCRQRRSLMPGPSHHQGTASLTRFKDQMEEKEKRPVSDVSAYISSRKGSEGDSLCHDRAKRVVEKYAEVAKEKFGQDFDIMNEPLDPSCAYKAGCGKKHGRLLIGNGYVDSQETVSNSRTMSGATTDEMRPTRRMRTSVDRIAEVEAQLKQLQQQILYLTQNQNPQVEEAQGSGQLGITGTADSVGNNIAVNLETSQEQVDECNNVVPT